MISTLSPVVLRVLVKQSEHKVGEEPVNLEAEYSDAHRVKECHNKRKNNNKRAKELIEKYVVISSKDEDLTRVALAKKIGEEIVCNEVEAQLDRA